MVSYPQQITVESPPYSLRSFIGTPRNGMLPIMHVMGLTPLRAEIGIAPSARAAPHCAGSKIARPTCCPWSTTTSSSPCRHPSPPSATTTRSSSMACSSRSPPRRCGPSPPTPSTWERGSAPPWYCTPGVRRSPTTRYRPWRDRNDNAGIRDLTVPRNTPEIGRAKVLRGIYAGGGGRNRTGVRGFAVRVHDREIKQLANLPHEISWTATSDENYFA
jgi:hypothetical protein